MRWQGKRKSTNIEDRRGRARPRNGARKAGGLGGVGLIAVLLIGYFMGIDVTPLLQEQGQGSYQENPTQSVEITDADRKAGDFVAANLALTEDIWADIFRKQIGLTYKPVTLVLFKGTTSNRCGGASGATGPFYCPGDKKAYLDTSFFTTLEKRLGAGGDFAAAYVIAHEVSHYVQDELGILSKANEIRARSNKAASNAISVRIELQADCYSGIWAREANKKFNILERGDLAEAINAAKQIGDDTLQRNAGRTPLPHTFTHGTSKQRVAWFKRGLKSGDIRDCDTFGAKQL